MTLKRSFHVEAPAETVFDYLKTLKWRDITPMDIYDVKQTGDGIGTSFSWGFKIAGVPFGGFDVYTDVVPNKRILRSPRRSP